MGISDEETIERFVIRARRPRASVAYPEALAELPDGFERDLRMIEGID